MAAFGLEAARYLAENYLDESYAADFMSAMETVANKKILQEQLEEKRAKKKGEEALKEKRLEKAETLEKLLEKIRTGAGASVKIQEEGKGAQLDLTI